MTAANRTLTQVGEFDQDPALCSLSTIQQIRNVFEDATQSLQMGSAADSVLKQLEGMHILSLFVSKQREEFRLRALNTRNRQP